MKQSDFQNKLPFSKENLPSFMLVRDIVFTTIIGGMASFMQYIFNFITVNRLPRSSYGVFSAVLGLIYLVQIPALSLQTFFAKEVAEDKRYRDKRVIISTVRRFTKYALFAMFLTILFTPLIANFMQIDLGYILMVSILVFGAIFTPVLRGYLLGLKKIDLFNIFTIVEAVLKLLILLVALNISVDPTGPVLAYGIPTLIVGLMMFWIIKNEKDQKSKGKKDLYPSIHWKFLGITLITLFLYNSVFSLDVILLVPGMRASYGSLVLLGKIVFFASLMASSVMFSYLVNSKDRDEKNRYLYISVALNVAVSVAIIAIYMVFSNYIVEIMFSGGYKEIIPFILPLSIGVSFYSLAYLFINYLLSEGKKGQVYILLGTSLLQLVLFSQRNSSLQEVVTNQVIVYSAIALSIIIFWYYSQREEN